ncbi:MAG: MBL fold metallo-hydrolase [Clostridia bacterium]|nr:MBL fold metallo-hydrolase [Clostridia bacterium]
MNVKKFESRMLGANTYIIYKGNQAAIIDPCAAVSKISGFLKENSLKPKVILLTHAHIDHMLHIDEYRNDFGIKAAVHEADFDSVSDSSRNGARLFGMNRSFRSADIRLRDGDMIQVDDETLSIISTPGHTKGSISIYTPGIVFTGDTLFYMSVGRTDLGDGSQADLLFSLKNKLMKLPGNTTVYPGHGTKSMIEFERMNNPYI